MHASLWSLTLETGLYRRTVAAVLAFAILCPALARAIDFHDSVAAARKADENKRPAVLVFGAAWCGWCRKLENETLQDKSVVVLGEQFLWIKVDIDKQEELAARYKVRGVPHTAVLDAQDRLLGSQAGYMTAAKFTEFLQASLTNPAPQSIADPLDDLLQKLATADSAELPSAVKEVAEHLARPDRAARKQLLAALADRGTPVWPVLLELMADQRLALRAAAAAALAHATGAELPFQAFDPAADRAKQLEAWTKWVQDHATKDS